MYNQAFISYLVHKQVCTEFILARGTADWWNDRVQVHRKYYICYKLQTVTFILYLHWRNINSLVFKRCKPTTEQHDHHEESYLMIWIDQFLWCPKPLHLEDSEIQPGICSLSHISTAEAKRKKVMPFDKW